MINNEIDWLDELEGDLPEPTLPEDDRIKTLSTLGVMYQHTEEMLAEAESQVDRLKRLMRRIREDLIPEKMMEYGVKKVVLSDGSELGYAPFYKGKVLDPAGYDWLEETGYPGAVKQEMVLSTSRIDSDVLNQFREFIMEKRPDNLSVTEKVSIHHMTLSSVIKELTKQGKELPKGLFEIFIGNVATLKKGKSDEQ